MDLKEADVLATMIAGKLNMHMDKSVSEMYVASYYNDMMDNLNVGQNYYQTFPIFKGTGELRILCHVVNTNLVEFEFMTLNGDRLGIMKLRRD
jgi:hypothetical protein